MVNENNRHIIQRIICAIASLFLKVGLISLLFVVNANAAETKYVTPQMFGAAADGVTDDSDALQSAIDSGYPVYLPEGEYYITRPIRVYNKMNLWVQGSAKAVIHRKHDESQRAFLFNMQNCYYCMFRDLNITSDMEGVGSIPNGHTRPSNRSSNILAFGGKANSNIYFYNNAFTNMESDYWFNDETDGWNNIVISGWVSRDSITAMFGQNCSDIYISNADIVLNSEIAGDGDHCIYISDGSSKIRIKNSTFDAGIGDYGEGSPNSVLTFHKTSNAAADAFVTDVTIESSTIKGGRFLYGNCGNRETISVNNCQFEQTFSRGVDYTGAFGGNANYKVLNSRIDVNTYTVTGTQDDNTGTVFYNCVINAEPLNTACFANATNLWVFNSDVNVGKLLLYNNESNLKSNVTFNNCSINSSGNTYLLSKRSKEGTIAVINCLIENANVAGNLVYNGKSTDMTGFTIRNCIINGYNTIANTANISNASISNTYLNGELINQ